MSRRNATATNSNQSPNKRVRFDATSAHAPNGDPLTATASTPKAIADSFITNHVVSLQPQLASILEKLGLQHLDLLHVFHNKKSQLTRMESNEEFIPRSARIEFKFHMSKNAEERPEFLALQEETDSHIATFRIFLRGQIIKATKIESMTIVENINIGFVKAIRVCTEAFLIGDDTPLVDQDITHNTHALVSTIMDTYHTILLKHTTFQSLAEFCDLYKRIHNLQTFPISQGTRPAAPSTSGSRYFNTGPRPTNTSTTDASTDPNNNPTTVNPLEASKIKRALEAVFISPFDEYIKQCKRNSINLSLKKLSTAHFAEEATNNAAMELDREPGVDRSQLQDIIKKQTQSENKALVREIKKLSQKLAQLESSKKTMRGPTTPGASPQKQVRKTHSSKQHTQNRNRNRNAGHSLSTTQVNAGAGGSNNASRGNNGKKTNKRGTNHTQGNGTRSKTKRSK